MCGIAGFYGPYDRNRLGVITRALAHRGPDDEGLDWQPASTAGMHLGLGHRRLSIIDLGGGHQPMWTADSSLAIVFNGEIYNYRELRTELSQEGAVFRTSSDTEVILEGWRLRGPRILSALSGMFAFAIWNKKDQEWVFARDRAGIKPLYYTLPRSDAVVFASEIKPLLPFLPNRKVNLRALYEFLLFSWTVGPETIFSGVNSLPPGTWARWSPTQPEMRPQRYVSAGTAKYRGTREDAAADLRIIFDRAVQSHLVADVPVGINLSGGLDSSAVLESMSRYCGPETIDAFTVGFGLADDETPFAQLIAQHVGVKHHVSSVPPSRFEEDFATIVRTIEEPIGHPVLQTTYEVARFSREKVKVVMIGEGSDELFLGYPEFSLLRPPFRFAPRDLFRKFFIDVTCLMPSAKDIAGMLRPEFLDRDLLYDVEHKFDRYFRMSDLAEGAQDFEIQNPLVSNQLMRIDKLTMAHGLEARVPFLDQELVEWSRSLPFGYKLNGKVTKAVLRDAMATRLPEAIRHRPKTGKGGTQGLLPYLDRLATTGPLGRLISYDAIDRRGWLKPERVMGYWAQGEAMQVRAHPIERRKRSKFRYSLCVLEQWAREFLD